MEKLSAKNEKCGTCGEEEKMGSMKLKSSARKKPVYTDHSPSLKRLNRVRGQLDGVSRMIEERQYCLDILQQIRAASSALRGLEGEILRGHLKGCVQGALDSKNPFSAAEKIEEIISLWSK